MNMNRLILLANFVLIKAIVLAQPVLMHDDNVIYQPQPITIDTYNKVFKVVHIGDSHIQADWFSGKLRSLLQEQYGNAGIGILFPYRQIKTNSPPTFSSVASAPFIASKITKCKTACDVGIVGYNAQIPAGSMVVFNIKKDTQPQFVSVIFQSDNEHAIGFNHDNHDENYTTQTSTTYNITSYKKPLSNSFHLNTKSNITLNGLISSNGNPGVIYYTIGANGATFNNYINSNLFFQQLKSLQPDLIIISMGTNESVSDISADSLSVQLQNFHSKILEAGADKIIYTTPADNYLRKSVSTRKKVKGKWRTRRTVAYINNPKVEIIRQTMINFCNQQQVMCWDLYRAMGGDRSMRQWVQTGYAAKDHIHFSKGGYEIQGMLLFDALQKYVINK
jgi:lysophospholipase L1-like esterase